MIDLRTNFMFFLLTVSVSFSIFAESNSCGFGRTMYAQAKGGENLLDIGASSGAVGLLFFENKDFKEEPVYIFSNWFGLFDVSKLPSPRTSVSFEMERRKELDKFKNDPFHQDTYYPLFRDPDLPVVLSKFSDTEPCMLKFFKVEELIDNGFKIKFRGKFYYFKDYYETETYVNNTLTKIRYPSELFFYLDESTERAWVEKLKKDKTFVDTFEKIKSALLKRDKKALQTLMLPGAEDSIKALYDVIYYDQNAWPYYYDFFFDYACNPFNRNILRLSDDKEKDCNVFQLEFPIVTYRPKVRGNSNVQGEVVFIRVNSTGERREEFVDHLGYRVTPVNVFGDQGFVLVRDGLTWKIKDVYLDNNDAPVAKRFKMQMPAYWGRIDSRGARGAGELQLYRGAENSKNILYYKGSNFNNITRATLDEAEKNDKLIAPGVAKLNQTLLHKSTVVTLLPQNDIQPSKHREGK